MGGSGLDSSAASRNPFSQTFQKSNEIRIANLKDELEATHARIDGSFQAIMLTMSMIESQKAIARAETVGKLTSLAFFFIPLSFVTGIFGMNIVVGCVPPSTSHTEREKWTNPSIWRR